MSNTNILERVNRRARQIVKENPNISYRDAQKQAGLERREGVSGRKKSRHKVAGKGKSRQSVARKVRGTEPVYKVHHVVERIGASQINATEKRLENELKAQRAWQLLALDGATNAKARAKARKELAENKRKLKAIGSRKKAATKKRRK